MKTDMVFSQEVLQGALRSGATEAEVFEKSFRNLSVDVREGKVEAMETSTGFGYALRVIINGRLGFSYSNARDKMDFVIDSAIRTAGITEQDEFLDLPEPLRPENPEVFDPAVEAITEEEAIRNAFLVEENSLSGDRRLKKVRKASASFSVQDTSVVNSRGISYGYTSTSLSAQTMVVAEEDGDSQTGWGFQAGRFLGDMSYEQVGIEAARRSLELLGARRMETVKAPVLLDRSVAAGFLSLFASMLSSESVQKGKSLLKGQSGRKVVSGLIDIIDDGLLKHAPGTRHIDDEGVPACRKELIAGGVLRGFMYSTHTARKDNVQSTGNAIRSSSFSIPSTGPLNLFIDSRATKQPLESMLEGMDSGLYVTEAMGMHTANPISGEFSVGVNGLWVEGGEIRYPVKEAVISGNVLEFFSDLQAVGSDLTFYGAVGSPSILMGPTDISA